MLKADMGPDKRSEEQGRSGAGLVALTCGPRTLEMVSVLPISAFS